MKDPKGSFHDGEFWMPLDAFTAERARAEAAEKATEELADRWHADTDRLVRERDAALARVMKLEEHACFRDIAELEGALRELLESQEHIRGRTLGFDLAVTRARVVLEKKP